MMITGLSGMTSPRKTGRFFARTFSLVLVVTAITACEDLLEVAADPHFVDPEVNPALLAETMVGAQADMYFSYDVWMYETNMFSGGMTSVSLLRYTQSQRQLGSRGGGEAGGLTGGGRETRGPSVAYYSFLQVAINSSNAAQGKILAGEFPDISDPANSAEYARVSVYNGFETLWMADFYCEFVLFGQGPVLKSIEGYQLAADQFQNALNATNAESEIRQAALAGLARANRLLGNLNAARLFAEQVDPDFEFLARYSTNTQEQTNHIWFRTWGFGEHGVSPAFRNLTVDDTGIEDSRIVLEVNPVPARGQFDDVHAPLKVPSGSTLLIITSGVEMQFIMAEAALATDPTQTVTMINQIRTQRGVNIAWAPAGTGENEIRDKLIDERRRTMLFEGTLMGDTRLYIFNHGLDLFQTEIPQGFEVQNATCRLLLQSEIDGIPGLVFTPDQTGTAGR